MPTQKQWILNFFDSKMQIKETVIIEGQNDWDAAEKFFQQNPGKIRQRFVITSPQRKQPPKKRKRSASTKKTASSQSITLNWVDRLLLFLAVLAMIIIAFAVYK